MPRKKAPSPREWRQWLEWRDDGMSETTISKNTGRQLETVRKYLLIAEEERRFNLAQLDLIKSALKSHQSQLMGVVDGLLHAVSSQPETPQIPWPFSNVNVIDITGGSLAFSYGGHRVDVDLTIDAEKAIELEVLGEHLPNDPLWRELKSWRLALWSFFQVLATFKDKVAITLVQQTGGRYVDENLKEIQTPRVHPKSINEPSIDLLAINAVELIYKRALKLLLRNTAAAEERRDFYQRVDKELEELGQRVKENKELGEVRFNAGNIIAYCRGEEAECKEAILKASRTILTSAEARQVIESHRLLVAKAAPVLKTLQTIKLGILILGECRVCKRFKR